MQADARTSVRISAIAIAGSIAALFGNPGWAQQPTAAASGDEAFLDELLGDESAGKPDAAAAPAPENPAPAAEAPHPGTEAPPQTIPVAQEAPAPSGEPLKDPGSSRQIEEIVVTATKREQILRDIPASISEFSGERLESQGQSQLSDYLRAAPGVTLAESSPNLPRISIRGISTDTNALSGTPSPTGILIGDVAFSDPYIPGIQPDLSAFDLKSVEVLKGPQGTLFGGAALSGAIRYVLEEPAFDEWSGRGFAQYKTLKEGSDAFTSGIVANIPLYKDRLAARVAYVSMEYPGSIDNTRAGGKKDIDQGRGDQLRAMLSWRPWDALLLKYTHLEQDYSSKDASTSSDFPDRRETSRFLFPTPLQNSFSLDSLEARYDFSEMQLVSLTSRAEKSLYGMTDVTAALFGVPPPGYPILLGAYGENANDAESFSQELRLQSTGGDGPQWLVGLYFYRQTLTYTLLTDLVAHQRLLGYGTPLQGLLQLLPLPETYYKTSLLYAVTTPDSTEKALFFDVSERFWNRLELSLGARLYETEVRGGFFGTGILALAANNGQDINYTDNHLSEKGVSPKIAATFDISDDISVYAQVARGFRFGGLQSVPSGPLGEVPQVYKSDSLWNHEIGIRTNWLDNSLQFDLTAFYMKLKDPQIRQTTNGIPLPYTDNVGGAVSRGLESSLRWAPPIDGLEVSLAAALTDAHTTEPFTATDGSEIPAGTQMPGAAKSQYTVGLSHALPLGATVVGSYLNYSYVGKGRSDIINEVAINDYGTLNAGLSLSGPLWGMRPSLAINLNNILDTIAVATGSESNSLAGIPVGSYGLIPPRTISVRLGLEFGGPQ